MPFQSEEEYNLYLRDKVLCQKRDKRREKTRLKSRRIRGKKYHNRCSLCGMRLSENNKKQIGLYKFCSIECRRTSEILWGRNIRSEMARKWMNKYPEKVRAEKIAKKIPLAEFCELCPEDDKRKSVMRHHPDYDYPEIFVSVCGSCHRCIHNQDFILNIH